MIDRLFREDDDGTALEIVQNLVIIALWTPLIIVLWGAAIALAIFLYRSAIHGDTGDLAAAAEFLGSDVAMVALVVGLGWLYLMLTTATFGKNIVSDTTQEATEIREELE